MSERIGLIQTRGIGDIIIALPIAQEFLDRGHAVDWPIDSRYVAAFKAAEPKVNFLPVEDGGDETFYDVPLQILKASRCDRIISLYSAQRGPPVANAGLAYSLKFDEFKYAAAGIRFSRKWELRIIRDPVREQALFDRLNIKEPYVCLHTQGSGGHASIELPPQWLSGRSVVRIEPLTDNPFDWILTLERASHLVLIDSCFANLVEQLNLPNPKTFLLRSPVEFTPVLKNAWSFAGRRP